jgi:hypothetical protein
MLVEIYAYENGLWNCRVKPHCFLEYLVMKQEGMNLNH